MAKSSSEYFLYGAVYVLNASNTPDVIFTRVDATDGSIIWTSPKLNYIPSPAYIDDLNSAAMGRGNASYATGRIYINGSNTSGMRSFITKFDSQGNHLWAKYLLHTFSQSARVYGTDIIYDSDSLILSLRLHQ